MGVLDEVLPPPFLTGFQLMKNRQNNLGSWNRHDVPIGRIKISYAKGILWRPIWASIWEEIHTSVQVLPGLTKLPFFSTNVIDL